MSEMTKICGALVALSALYFCVESASAETRIEQALRFSDLAKSSMECSQLTRQDDEAKRLFTIAMTAGEKFLSLFESSSDEEKEQVKFKMDFAWWFAYDEPGNYNFRLGRLWSAIKFDRDLDFDREDSKRNRKADYKMRRTQMQIMYANKNCRYIH